jgi:hypothetical protein
MQANPSEMSFVVKTRLHIDLAGTKIATHNCHLPSLSPCWLAHAPIKTKVELYAT